MQGLLLNFIQAMRLQRRRLQVMVQATLTLHQIICRSVSRVFRPRYFARFPQGGGLFLWLFYSEPMTLFAMQSLASLGGVR